MKHRPTSPSVAAIGDLELVVERRKSAQIAAKRSPRKATGAGEGSGGNDALT